MKIITHDRCVAYAAPGHPERPARIRRSVERLKQELELPIEWVEPGPADEALLREAHTPRLIERLEEHVDFDADTPAHEDIAEHARRSVGGGLLALDCALRGQAAFSLLRPPGHHATRDTAMGFCYLNNVALATLAARARGLQRVAVFDFDVHHGNGTEDILLDRPGCAFFSIHQFPAYPGTGRRHRGGNCFNYPVPPGLPRLAYREVAEKALDALRGFKPELIAVSAGFDAYARDPLCQQALEPEDFHWFGQVFREMGLPMFSLLEGGYSDDLPELILAYLRGLSGLPLQKTALEPAPAGSPVEEDPGHEPFWGPAF